MKIKKSIDEIVFLLIACTSILSIALICYFIFRNGLPAIQKIGVKEFLLGTVWKPEQNTYGIFQMIIGSLIVTFGSAVIGVPIGLLAAIYLAYFCDKKLYKIIKPAIDLMAGIPSIVYGFFGLVVFVPIFRDVFSGSGKSIFTASFLLGIMILPQIITVSENSIISVRKSYYEASLALGVSHERSVFQIVVPAAHSGIKSSIILGIGRSIGETMAVIMVIGNQAIMPRGLFKGMRTLTGNIVLEMGYATGLHREALLGTAMVLFIIVLMINAAFFLQKRSSD